MTEIESWRELADDRIEFVMRRRLSGVAARSSTGQRKDFQNPTERNQNL
jgi:hypothetical protein